jgi:predicted DNA-binding transcriptional regulator YafY
MARKQGPDPKKIQLIIDALKHHPQGIWIRELARASNLDKSTVSRYISTYLADKVEIPFENKQGIKLVRLKNTELTPSYVR